ncbi:cadmium resistance transporter [Furfurilactobacillus siliginis]|nr:cadmium resistance transporter [Furfurilactobacillus siliginis]GEK29010.1 cadmium resistance protein CadD [Furfurilactobacillus siliginis]
MLTAFFTGLGLYVSTSIDNLIVLTVIFGSTPRSARWSVYWGDLLGAIILVVACLLCAFALGLIPQPWLLGLLGLIPIVLGIRLLVVKDADDEAQVANEMKKKRHVLLNVALITVTTCGADNVGIYVPLFTQTSRSQLGPLLTGLFVMLTIFCWLGYRLATMPHLTGLLKRYGSHMTAVVYIVLGCAVLWESGTITHFL